MDYVKEVVKMYPLLSPLFVYYFIFVSIVHDGVDALWLRELLR
jgi:hypothetical protein